MRITITCQSAVGALPWRLLSLAVALLCMASFVRAQEPSAFVFACRPDNDLYRALSAGTGRVAPRFDDPARAVAHAPEGAGVLLLADGYPTKTTALDAALFEAAAKKSLRLFVEFPSWLPDLSLSPVRHAAWERTVVTSDAFGPALEKMRILMIQDCYFVPVEATSPHLVLARVAGFDSAVYGLPKKEVWPILFEHPRGGVLAATTKLSQFITGRYAPSDAWPPVWNFVLGWLGRTPNPPKLEWIPTVRPAYTRLEPLPPNSLLQAVRRGVDWYSKARMFVHPDWAGKWDGVPADTERIGPGPTEQMPRGNGSFGLLEAFSSAIGNDGSQPVRYYVRADCNSEAAFALALRGVIDQDQRSRTIASNLLDFVDFKSPIQQGARAEAQNAAFGLMGWDTRPAGTIVHYGDDNARAVLGQLGVAAALKEDRWDEAILRCILANFCTTGPSGFRNARIDEPELQEKGWRWFWAKSSGAWGSYRECAHYQAYQWAVNLWLYDKTKFAPLLERTERGLRHMMRRYPNGWQAESGREEGERCRMLLPLAWLVRVQETAEHRLWLPALAQYIRGVQDSSGAIQQRVTHTAGNEEYGTGECPLVHANGDPATDLLYAGNFAFLGLHEAAAATGDGDLKSAADRLADFLVRVQVRSSHPAELDGVWFRGFDFRRWDYWGSNGDVGWGVWATETGWTQGWISGVLALRHLNQSLWELTAQSRIARHMDRLRVQMLPDDALAPKVTSVTHAAAGKAVKLRIDPAPQYSAQGSATLCDGELADEQTLQDGWLGWQGAEMNAIVDLGAPQAIHRIGARFLQFVPAGVFLPPRVEFAVSQDGVSFEVVATVKPTASPREEGPITRILEATANGKQARFVQITAQNFGAIPDWQKLAPGAPAWLFCDEILINPKP